MEEKERGWPLCDVLCAKRSVAGATCVSMEAREEFQMPGRGPGRGGRSGMRSDIRAGLGARAPVRSLRPRESLFGLPRGDPQLDAAP